jgi:TetR/AcrR family transcriptional regulator, cholesterol catabolism regulator
MTRPSTDSRHDILHAAAQLFRERGYDAASMNDLAAALNLSKGALYHHFQSKDEILFHIMQHAMEITEEQVKKPVLLLSDPQERLRSCIRLHIHVVLQTRDREITVMLHENHPLPAEYRRLINARKKEHMHFVERLIEDAQHARSSASRVTPKAAAFALLGMINWIYQWYRSDGTISEADLVDQFTEIMFAGVFGA